MKADVVLIAVVAAWLLAGAALADCPTRGLTPIRDLMPHGDTFLPAGRSVVVRGIVTGDFRGPDRLNGFWLQSEDRAADGLPSGIFVYAPDAERKRALRGPGSEVTVAAESADFRGRRQLSRVKDITGCGERGVPAPVPLDLPSASEARLRRHEGLLVRFTAPLTVTDNEELGRYGSLGLSAGGRLFRPTNFPEGPVRLEGRRRIVLDDGSYRQNPRPTPFLDGAGTRRIGSRIPQLEGILAQAFDQWRIHPLDPARVAFEALNPRPEPPVREGFRVAAFNVENYFLSLGKRGAASRKARARQRKALGAVAKGLRADLIGLVEVENRPEAADDLVARLAGASAVPYGHFRLPEPVGTDAIRVVLAWNEARVELLGGPFIDRDPVHHRPPVAGHFRFGDRGPGVIVAVIHHKSKSACPEAGDIDRGQGCWNRLRTEQSRALAKFLRGLAKARGTDRVLVLGDINSYGGETPVRLLRQAGFVDLIAEHLPPEARYTYVYQGEAGYLDNALATPALATAVEKVRIWHINADEPPFLRHRAGPWRSSDHDPVVMDFRPRAD